MKILTIDIETSPNLAHVWGLWNENIPLARLLESGEVICFAAKWYGAKRVMFHSIHHDGKEQMLAKAYEYISDADVVVHYNGDRFDIPHLNREFIEANMEPPAPYASIDLFKVVKKKFKFPSNKLDYVVQKFNLGAKVPTDYELWLKCLDGNDRAWGKMRKYNKRDVVVTEALYDKLRPWIPSHPSVGLYEGLSDVCPACGGSHLTLQGRAFTSMGTYQRYQCGDCGKWSRGNKRLEGSNLRGLA